MIEMQKPMAVNAEWKQHLEAGFEDCPRNYFKKVPLSTNPRKRSELQRCVEVYLSLLNGNSSMFDIFFAQEETGYELADPAEKESEYINFRLVISAYVLRVATVIMKNFIKINYGMMVRSEEGKWKLKKNADTNIWRYVSPFTWQFVRQDQHIDMIHQILDMMDHGGEAWSEMMAEAVEDFVNHRSACEFPSNKINSANGHSFGDWKNSEEQ